VSVPGRIKPATAWTMPRRTSSTLALNGSLWFGPPVAQQQDVIEPDADAGGSQLL
jgi:hypothetical protein